MRMLWLERRREGRKKGDGWDVAHFTIILPPGQYLNPRPVEYIT